MRFILELEHFKLEIVPRRWTRRTGEICASHVQHSTYLIRQTNTARRQVGGAKLRSRRDIYQWMKRREERAKLACFCSEPFELQRDLHTAHNTFGRLDWGSANFYVGGVLIRAVNSSPSIMPVSPLRDRVYRPPTPSQRCLHGKLALSAPAVFHARVGRKSWECMAPEGSPL